MYKYAFLENFKSEILSQKIPDGSAKIDETQQF